MRYNRKNILCIILILIISMVGVGSQAETMRGTVGDLNWELTDSGILTFSGNGKLQSSYYITSYEYLNYRYQTGNINQVIINEGCVLIQYSAFQDLQNLMKVTLPESLETIEESAFKNCTVLQTIVIPSKIKTIEAETFSGCTRLKNITIPNSVTNIRNFAFSGCAFTTISIPASVQNIGAWAFSSCKNLISFTMPEGITMIQGYTFYQSNNLESIVIPKSVNLIESSAFAGCAGLKTVYYSGTEAEKEEILILEDNDYLLKANWICNQTPIPAEDPTVEPEPEEEPDDPENVVIIDGNVYTLDFKKLTASFDGPKKETATKITIPATIKAYGKTYKVTSIGSYACQGLKELKSVSIGSNVKTIGEYAFAGCKKLKTVSGGSGIETIHASAFMKCTALSTITLNSKVKTIGKNSFSGCSSLKNINIKTTKLTLASISSNAFKNVNKSVTVTCPKAKISAYKSILPKRGMPKSATYKK